MAKTAKPRVVVADDSAFMRRLISDVLSRDGMDVVAEAADGGEAIEACLEHQPDVLSLDLAMPQVDGLEVLRRLRGKSNLKIVVVSSFSEAGGIRAVDALAEGAFELVPKRNTGGKLQDFLDDLLGKVQAATFERTPREDRPKHKATAPPPLGPKRRLPLTLVRPKAPRLVLIASSTGGPRALTDVVKHFPAALGQGLVIVQHMPAGFTRSLADRLSNDSALNVAEAAGGERIEASSGWVAPGGQHLRIKRRRIELTDDPPIGGLRPCADVTITDAVEVYGGDIVLGVLTGMGRDGCKGAELVKKAGGVVIAEHGSTTTVNGMPRAVINAGLADAILPVGEVGAALAEAAGA